jgi:glycosyltransferase involved in cell wall biosynthesis
MDKVKVLHILTMIEKNGEYGGPVTVARTLQAASRKSRYSLKLIGGTRETILFGGNQDWVEGKIRVRAISKRKRVSSLISLRIIKELWNDIGNSQLVHLHFARDLIQLIAAVICILKQKPYFIQTHGMIRKKNSVYVDWFDFALIVPILKKATNCFALSENEAQELLKICPQIQLSILRNGVNFENHLDHYPKVTSVVEIVFCSRLHSTKGIKQFCELAKKFEGDSRYVFRIYGPDGGELNWVENFILVNSATDLRYMGSLKASEVLEMLKRVDLLVLPSNYDPYPMIVLEALSVGTPVLINSVCGQSEEIRRNNNHFIYDGADGESLIEAFNSLGPSKINSSYRNSLNKKYEKIFGINQVWEIVMEYYDNTINGKKHD